MDPDEPVARPDPDEPEASEDFGVPDLAPDLAVLASELAAAGSRARARAIRDDRAAPDPAFAAALRAGLIAPTDAAAVGLPIRQATPAAVPRGVAPAGGAAPSRGAAPAGERAPAGARANAGPLFARLGAPRWTALGAVALLAFTALGLPTDHGSATGPQAHLATVSATSISHRGTVRPASDGATIETGDVITVGAGGRAVLVVGGSEARLASGASIQVDRLAPDAIALVQLTGRAYHRVDPAPGETYVVRTGSVTWSAHGTAFDIDRAVGVGDDEITVLSVEHTVTFQGPDLTGSLLEGRQAVVRLGGDAPDVAVRSADPTALRDSWLAENARRDLDGGWSAGILVGVASR